MKLTSPSNVRAILEDIGISPSKARGQNFLIDRNILDIIVGTAQIGSGDAVVEIGAGLGVLTGRLIQKARHVTAIEVDERLCEYLRGRFADAGNLRLVCSDVLELDLDRFMEGGRAKVVANLPYSVASRVLVGLAMSNNPPARIVATIQLEVAQRLVAKPGTTDYGFLTVRLQSAYEVSLRRIVNNTCFWPVPRVMSALVAMERRDAGTEPKNRWLFHGLVKHAFMYRRKQLATILKGAPAPLRVSAARCRELLETLGIGASARPENLSVEDWRMLANAIAASDRRS